MEHYGKLLVFGLSTLYVYRQKCICGLNQRPMWVHKSENRASKTHAKKTYTQEYTGIFRIKCNIKQTITGLLDCSTRLVSSMLCWQTPMIRKKTTTRKTQHVFSNITRIWKPFIVPVYSSKHIPRLYLGLVFSWV
jgi:hypothetical protein